MRIPANIQVFKHSLVIHLLFIEITHKVTLLKEKDKMKVETLLLLNCGIIRQS